MGEYSINEKKPDRWFWSSSHTRLRFQLVSSSLLFCTLAIFPTKTIGFPFFSVEWEENSSPSINYILTFIFLFSISTLVSYVLRSKTEKQLSQQQDILFRNKIDKIVSELDAYDKEIKLLGESINNSNLDLSAIKNEVKAYKVDIAALPGIIKSYIKSVSKYEKSAINIIERKQSILLSIEEIIRKDVGKNNQNFSKNEVEKRLNHIVPTPSYSKPNDIESYYLDIAHHSYTVDQILKNNLTNNSGVINKMLVEIKFYEKSVASLLNDFERIRSDFSESTERFSEVIKSGKDVLVSKDSYFNISRELDFWIPSISSILLLLVGCLNWVCN